MTTATMNAQERAEARIQKLTDSLDKKAAKVVATIDRNAYRQGRAEAAARKAQERAEKAAARIAKLEAAVIAAKERAEAAKERAEQATARILLVTQKGEQTYAKQQAAVNKTGIALNKAREKAATIAAKKPRSKKPAGTVTGEDGVVHGLDAETVMEVKAKIGRKKSGCFNPIDGEEAQAILDALDSSAGGNSLGDEFTVVMGTGKPVHFSITSDGLSWYR